MRIRDVDTEQSIIFCMLRYLTVLQLVGERSTCLTPVLHHCILQVFSFPTKGKNAEL